MGSRKKTKFLRCMLCNGIDMGFPSEFRGNRETKMSERRQTVQFMAVHENEREILVMCT